MNSTIGLKASRVDTSVLAANRWRCSPERIQHARIKARLWAALDTAIQQAGVDSEALPDGVPVEIGHQPDAIVNRGPPADPEATAAANPVIVAEVLSPNTQSIDTSDKLIDYFRIPSGTIW